MATSSIVDITGQPFDLSDLSEPQTETGFHMSLLRQHQSGHPVSGLTLNRIASILKDAEDGDLIRQCELAEDMEEKDAHLQSELAKRRLALQGVKWNIVAPRNATAAEQRDAELIEEILRDATWLQDAIFDASDAILKGFANLELEWQYAEKTHYVAAVHWRDPAWFQLHPDDKNELRLRDGSPDGAALRPFGWICHQGRAKSGYLARRGLARVVVWPFLFKNYSLRDLAEFLEIYGIPIRLGKYPSGANPEERSILKRAIMSIGHNAGGVIPQGMDIEILEAAKGTDGPYMAMINWGEKSISKAVLGGTLTSQADGKSSTNALGNVHNEVRQEIRDADLVALQNTLTRDLVYPLYVLNGGSFTSPRRIPRFEFDTTEPESLQKFVQPLRELVDMDFDVPISFVREKTKIPKPVDGEPVLKRPTSQTPASLKASGVDAAVAALKGNTYDPLDELVDTVHRRTSGATDQVVNDIRRIVEGAEDFDQMREQLMALRPDHGQLADTMAEALTIASLAGRHDILQEAQ